MHKPVKRALTGDEIQTYRRDGVVLVRGLVDPDWVVKLQELVDQNIIQPSTMVREINEPGGTGNFFGDTFVCHQFQDSGRLFLNRQRPMLSLPVWALGALI